MSRIVVDASVVAKLFFPEARSAGAVRVVKTADELLAPELLWAELASVVWKRHRRSEIDQDQAQQIFGEMTRLPIRTYAHQWLGVAALKLAIETDRSVYDCLYLALAIDQQCRMVTADERLTGALTRGPLARYVRLLPHR